MPYRRKKRKYTRASAATTLQKAWRRKRAKKKGSVLQRQCLSNKRQIKKLYKSKEVKESSAYIAKPSTNWMGQVLSLTPVSNYGLPITSYDWSANAVTGNNYLPLNPDGSSKYQPLWICPLITQQGVSESRMRVGNKIKMRSLIVKGQVVGGACHLNRGIYQDMPFTQKMRILLIHDSCPNVENNTLSATTPTYQFDAIPGQLFSFSNTWNDLLPAGSAIADHPQLADNIKAPLLPGANPPGISLALANAQCDLFEKSYYDRDELRKKRFKILKQMVVTVEQRPPPQADAFNNPKGYHVKNFQMVCDHPYSFTYADDRSMVPNNQRLYVAMVSDVPTMRSVGTTPPPNYVIPPAVTLQCKLNFTDS